MAFRFCRIAYQMVAGRQVFRHPCLQQRSYILEKLNAFHAEHDTPMADIMTDLHNAIEQIPAKEHAAKAKPLQEKLQASPNDRKRGPQLLRDILPIILARLEGSVQLPEKPTSRSSTGTRAENASLSPRRKASEKHGALSDHQRLIRRRGVTPLMYQYGDTVITPRERIARDLEEQLPTRFKNRP